MPGTTSNGTPCRRAAYPGGTRCHLHGGASPQAKAAAQRVLDRARLLAIEALFAIIDTFLAAIADGNPTGDAHAVIKACIAVLDRTGLHPTLSVKHSKDDSEPEEWMESATDEELQQIVAFMQRIRAQVEQRMRTLDLALPTPAPNLFALPVAAQDGVVVETEDEEG